MGNTIANLAPLGSGVVDTTAMEADDGLNNPVTSSGKITALQIANYVISKISTPTGYALSSQDGVTAHAGGGRGSATAITGNLVTVTIVATAGDSVVLPAAKQPLLINMWNFGTNAMQVFASGTDTINGISGTVGISQLNGTNGSLGIYTCTINGAWHAAALYV